MKMYLSCILAIISSTIFCGDGKYAAVPPVLRKICEKECKTTADFRDCSYLMDTLMKPSDLEKAEKARKIVQAVSCYDATLTTEEKVASNFLDSADKWAEMVKAPIQRLGQEHGLSEKIINEATAYCQARIKGKPAQMSESLRTEQPECFGCNLDKQLSLWLWGKKKQ